MLRLIRLILLFLILILGLSFAVINADTVQFDYYFNSLQAPLSLILVISLMLGALLGAAACLGTLLRLKREVARLHKTLKSAETEIITLRANSVKGIL